MKRGLLITTMLVIGLSVSPAWGGGLWLYEGGTPDLGTAAAGRAAMASDASTAGTNPAGMTRLDRSQVLAAFQGIYINSQSDTGASGFGGGDGGNAGGFVPSGGLHYVQPVTADLRLGISAGSYFGLGVDYSEDWAGRYYTSEAELVTFGVNPGIGYRVADWLSVGAGFSVLYAELTQKAAIRNAFDPGGDEHRTPDLPLDRQIRLGTGLQYEWNEDVTVGVAYEYLDGGKAKIDQEGGPLQGPLKGDYDPNVIHFLAANVIWKF